MGAVERIDVTAAATDGGPSRGLHSAGALEREHVEIPLPIIGGDAPFVHQAKQISVRRDVVESMVMHADVGNVRRHEVHGSFTALVQKPLLAGGVKLEDGGAKLEALCPLRPAAGGIAALHGEYGRARRRFPRLFERTNLRGRSGPELANARQQGRGGEFVLNVNHFSVSNLRISAAHCGPL